jgi:hypothetical protein
MPHHYLPFNVPTGEHIRAITTRAQCELVGADNCKCNRDQRLKVLSEARKLTLPITNQRCLTSAIARRSTLTAGPSWHGFLLIVELAIIEIAEWIESHPEFGNTCLCLNLFPFFSIAPTHKQTNRVYITFIHSYHSHLVPERVAEVSHIFRDVLVLPKWLRFEEYCRRDRW